MKKPVWCFKLNKNPKPFSFALSLFMSPTLSPEQLITFTTVTRDYPPWSSLSLAFVLIGHCRHSHCHHSLLFSLSLVSLRDWDAATATLLLRWRHRCLPSTIQGLFLFYLIDNSLGCHHCCVLFLLMKPCLTLLE